MTIVNTSCLLAGRSSAKSPSRVACMLCLLVLVLHRTSERASLSRPCSARSNALSTLVRSLSLSLECVVVVVVVSLGCNDSTIVIATIDRLSRPSAMARQQHLTKDEWQRIDPDGLVTWLALPNVVVVRSPSSAATLQQLITKDEIHLRPSYVRPYVRQHTERLVQTSRVLLLLLLPLCEARTGRASGQQAHSPRQ